MLSPLNPFAKRWVMDLPALPRHQSVNQEADSSPCTKDVNSDGDSQPPVHLKGRGA